MSEIEIGPFEFEDSCPKCGKTTLDLYRKAWRPDIFLKCRSCGWKETYATIGVYHRSKQARGT